VNALTEDRRRAIEQSGFGEKFDLVQPHNLAFWVYCLLVLAGAVVLSGQISIPAAASRLKLFGTLPLICVGVPRQTRELSLVKTASARGRVGAVEEVGVMRAGARPYLGPRSGRAAGR
jgi:hypothetical protein